MEHPLRASSPTTGLHQGPKDAGTYSTIASRRRTTLSLTDLRTPLVENLMNMLPSGHDKALKYALYNVLALIFAAVGITTLWAAYCILEPFIVPLLWALLCGSVIHPFKDRLVTFTKEWLGMVKESPTPLSFQFAFIPFRAIDSISEGIGTRVVTWWKYILVGSGGFFLTYLIYHNPPVTLGLVLYWIVLFLIRSGIWLVSWINGQTVVAVTVVYVGTILHCVYGPRPQPVRIIPAPQIKQEPQQRPQYTGDHQKDKIEEETDLGSGEGPPKSIPLNLAHPQEKLMMKMLAVTTWFFWFSYFCRLLPYPILFFVFLSLFTGTIIYIRKRRMVPCSLTTKYSTFLYLFGVGGAKLNSSQSSRGVSRKGSCQQPPRPRRNTQIPGTPSPGGAQVAQLMRDSSADTIFASPGGEEHDQVIGDTLLIKKLKPPMDLKLEQQQIMSPYQASTDNLGYYSGGEPLPSPTQSTWNCSEDEVDGVLDSNKFLYGVLCACLVVQLWNRFWLVHLLPIPVVYFGVKRLCITFGLKDYAQRTLYKPFVEFYDASVGPSQDLFPRPVRVFLRIIYEADRKVISVFESYLDMVATMFILVTVVVFSVILLIFVATQFYAEGDHLVRVGANVINSTVSQYPEISQMLPEGWESLTGSLIGNAYHYGRDYIKTMIRDSVAERNPSKAEEMEKQVIELWDRIYLSWNRTWGTFESTSADVTSSNGSGLEWDDIVKTGQNVTNWFDTNMLVNYAKSNYGQLRAVLESVYTVLVGNVSLALSAITSVLSVLFGGGTALLNLIISFVVFFTALFYLLSASNSVYKPVELFNTWLPGDGKHSSSFVSAIEESVSGVFSATLKMSAFYGMWTWLIHTLFQVNIVFVPSFFAAIFAAVPLLMPYWAAFPAVLELWLIQGQWTRALIMLGAQMAPMSLVDAQIYSEIKGGGHPYLTALAVAGGIFYFGFQGAIWGPVVLCVLFVAAKVSSSYMKEGTQLEFQ